jgi:hypothetical protein
MINSGNEFICPVDFLGMYAGTGRVVDVSTGPPQLIFDNGFSLPVQNVYLMEKESVALDLSDAADLSGRVLSAVDILENSRILTIVYNEQGNGKFYMIILDRGEHNPAAIALVGPNTFLDLRRRVRDGGAADV